MPLARARYRLGTWRLDRRRLRFYRQFVRRGSLCFDVGAHVGDRTALLLRLGARVVAVEPHAELQGKLRRRFGASPRFALVEAALGAEPGQAQLRWPDGGLGLASLSAEWTERVRESGRFADKRWSAAQDVRVTTLDALIEEFGLPEFCKVDVEGYEAEVVSGLSRPIQALSLEFTPERLESTERAVAHLDELGSYRFNYSLGETLVLVEQAWLGADALVERLGAFAGDSEVFGDVYARLG